jgi:cytochrome c oxidase assembly protein subunit 15
VASGLSDRTSVSQYRLAAHLSVALVLIGLAVWTAADLLSAPRPPGTAARSSRVTRLAASMVGLGSLTAVAGAFVAGLDAGKLYNTFPLMGGQVVPAGYGAMSPWYRNLFENLIAVQFNHRLLGIVVTLLGLALWWRTRHDDGAVGTWGRAVGYMSLVQIGLGIVTLVLLVPIAMASMHQAGAVVLLCFSLLLLHAARRGAVE